MTDSWVGCVEQAHGPKVRCSGSVKHRSVMNQPLPTQRLRNAPLSGPPASRTLHLRIKGILMDPSLTGLRQGGWGIVFTWSDGLEAELDPRTLRLSCTCARCISESTGQPLLDPATVPDDVRLTAIEPIGNYAYRCQFSDGHNTGLYTLELLRGLCERAAGS